MADLVCVLIDTGCRLSEALGLGPANLTDSQLVLWGDQTKSGRKRYVPLTVRAASILRRRVALARPWEGFTVNSVEYRWRSMKYGLNLDHDRGLVIHCLRHTFVSRLFAAGVPVRAVQEMAGHADLTTTLRYAHTTEDQKLDGIRAMESKFTESALNLNVTAVTPGLKLGVA